MQCFVYASEHKPNTYLWLAGRDELDVVPESLLLLLGKLNFVLEVELTEQRRLPVEDTRLVLEHLHGQRWHLQLPPGETVATATTDTPSRGNHDRRGD